MGFNKSVKFYSQPGLSRSVTFKQVAGSAGAAIQFVEQLPEDGKEKYIYALVRKHQVAGINKTPTVSFYICRQGQYYAVSDPRVQIINSDLVQNEKTIQAAYWACIEQKLSAATALKVLEESEDSTQEDIVAAQQNLAQLESQCRQLLAQLNDAKTLANAARQEAKEQDNNQ